MRNGSNANTWLLFILAALAGTAILAHATSLDLATARKVRREATRLETRLATVEPDAFLELEVKGLVRQARALEACMVRTGSTDLECHGQALETLRRYDTLTPRLQFEAQDHATFRRQLAKLETAMESLRLKVEGPLEIGVLRVNAVINGHTFDLAGRFKVEILTACIRQARAAGLRIVNELLIDGVPMATTAVTSC